MLFSMGKVLLYKLRTKCPRVARDRVPGLLLVDSQRPGHQPRSSAGWPGHLQGSDTGAVQPPVSSSPGSPVQDSHYPGSGTCHSVLLFQKQLSLTGLCHFLWMLYQPSFKKASFCLLMNRSLQFSQKLYKQCLEEK